MASEGEGTQTTGAIAQQAVASDGRTRAVVIGAGVAGLIVAQQLQRKKDFAVTLVTPKDTFCFLPRLTEYLHESIPQQKVILPLADVWRGALITARATAVNPEEKSIMLETGQSVPYDVLVIAVGSEVNTFNTPGANYAYPFYCKDDADKLREHLANMLSADDSSGTHTVVIVGAGPTGVEVASVIADIVKAKRPNGKIIIMDRTPKIMNAIPELSPDVQAALEKKGVQIRTGVAVSQITPLSIDIQPTEGNKETIPCYTTVWAAGSKPIRLAMAGVTLTERGEIPVEPTLQVKGLKDMYAIGDAAATGTIKTAQSAVQQAHHVVENILAAKATKPLKPFVFHYRGTIIALDNDTVGLFFGKKLHGFIARKTRDTYYSFGMGQYK